MKETKDRLNNNKISAQSIILLFDSLRSMNSKMLVINLNGIVVDESCMKSLGEYVKTNKYIEYIYITSALISDRCIEVLTPYVINNNKILGLSFYRNKLITNKSIPLLIKIIESTKIDSLCIMETSISQKYVLVPLLLRNQLKAGLKTLDLFRKFVNYFCKTIPKNLNS